MALTPVQKVKKKSSSDVGVMRAAGTIMSLIPATAPIGAAITAGTMLAPGESQASPMTQTVAQNEPALDMPDRSLAIQRRSDLGQQDPVEGLIQARESLAQLDLDPEQRARLQKPLDLALQAQRRV